MGNDDYTSLHERDKDGKDDKDAATPQELDERREAELFAVRSAAQQRKLLERSRNVPPDSPRFLVDVQWLSKWKRFIEGGAVPGPIQNDMLAVKPVPPALRQAVHYRGLNQTEWDLFHGWYGGGPPVVRRSMNIYSRPVSGMALLLARHKGNKLRREREQALADATRAPRPPSDDDTDDEDVATKKRAVDKKKRGKPKKALSPSSQTRSKLNLKSRSKKGAVHVDHRAHVAECFDAAEEDDGNVYLIHDAWLSSFQAYLQGHADPGPITNQDLLQPNKYLATIQKPRPNLVAGKDYQGIKSGQWALLVDTFHGGPAIIRPCADMYATGADDADASSPNPVFIQTPDT